MLHVAPRKSGIKELGYVKYRSDVDKTGVGLDKPVVHRDRVLLNHDLL